MAFIAILNKSGIACASDADHTIYRISRKEPLALAVEPDSPVCWEKIIDGYLARRNDIPKKNISFYARDFEDYLCELPSEAAWSSLREKEANIIFMGYGQDDVYPSVFDVKVAIDDEGYLCFGLAQKGKVGFRNPAFFHFLGDFERVAPLLFGATTETRRVLYESRCRMTEAYRERIMEKFKGTKYEQNVVQGLAKENVADLVALRFDQASDSFMEELTIGLDSFSMEDLVSAAETIVDANARLNHLYAGKKGMPERTKEIAVLTRVEGLTWIKHSLYAL